MQKDEPTTNTARQTLFVELPMPRDSHLLSPMSQALLRAARSGEITKKASPQPLQKDEKGNGEDDEPAADVDIGFMPKRWAAVPRHLEGPEPEFLAKRRKGLPSAYAGPLGQANWATPMRKTKVKKTDADGNATVLDVLVPEGQTVEGEVVEDEVNVTQAPAPGTVVEGVGVANAEGVIVAGDQMLPTPPRRRPPPPKRRAKGPGRGRKKKVAFAPGSEGQIPASSTAAPSRTPDKINGVPVGQQEIATADGDVSMGDDSPLHNGEESSEESDEGEDGDEGDREESELSPSPPSVKSPPKNSPLEEPPLSLTKEETMDQFTIDATDQIDVKQDITTNQDSPAAKDASSSPDLPLAADEEMAALANMSNPLEDRISGPDTEEQLLSVQEPSETSEQLPTEDPIVAEIPMEHNPLDGLAEPKLFNPNDPPPEQENQFSDGEVDLLGSLEKQLNRNETTVGTDT